MTIQIRTIREDEFEEVVRVVETAFAEVATPEVVENERRVAEIDRCLAALDEGRIVAGAAAYSLRLSVPGGEVSAAGVTSVGVLPTHRRRGINTALMRRMLDDARGRGEPIAALYASEGGIYGRFGFGLASFLCWIDLETERSAFVRGYRPAGRVELHRKADAIPRMLEVYESVRATRPGMPAIDPRWVEYRLHDHGPEREVEPFFAVHETGGTADGYAVYKVHHEWPGSMPHLELTVSDLMATSPQAYAETWRFVLDIDLVHRVKAWGRPVDEPLLHLLAEPRRLRLTLRDGLWIRLVDVPAALTARGYVGQGRVVVEVRDRFCPWNDGRFVLEADAGGSSCSPTDAEPELACDVNALGAAYLGGATFRQLWRAGQVEERRAGALARADALFAWDPAPWCPFVF